jgi:hypothetical protein
MLISTGVPLSFAADDPVAAAEAFAVPVADDVLLLLLLLLLHADAVPTTRPAAAITAAHDLSVTSSPLSGEWFTRTVVG